MNLEITGKEDIHQLHTSIQDCFKYLDERIYRAFNQPPKNRTVVVERDNTNLMRECEELRKQMKYIQTQYDTICVRYVELQKRFTMLKQSNEIQKQEIETQGEIIKQKKLSTIKQEQIESEQPINLYRSLKAYTKNNESGFSLFLSTIVHSRKPEKFIDLNDLLFQIERYYRPHKQPTLKFQIQSVDRVKFPDIATKKQPSQRVKKIHYKIKSALGTYEGSQSSIVHREARSISFQ